LTDLDDGRMPDVASTGCPMIDVDDVRKVYRSGDRWVEALRGITCRVPRGRFAFIVGPSGSGKSTLLYLLGALDRPTSGSIRIEGNDLTTMSESAQNVYRRDRVGFIFQSFNLISNLTAVENVLVPFLPRGVTSEQTRRAADLLREVGLGDRLDHRPFQLSGGEQQRVAIARALIKDPILVLGDEPTGELDSKTGDEIYRILRRLQRQRETTLVIVTHDRRFITPDDLVLEIQDGQLKADGLSESQDDLAEADVGFEPALGGADVVDGENPIDDRTNQPAL
jgi:putative ABC transport system ATP-binding protein